jgi:hypothetical protein
VTTPTSTSWREQVEQARKRLIDAGYPIPRKPQAALEDLVVPEDIDSLGPIPLANLTLRFQGWHAYVTTQLAFARAELTAFLEYYEVALGQRMNALAGATEGRPTKDVLKALALGGEQLRPTFTRKIFMELQVSTLEGLEKGLAIQSRAMVNEQIRRHAAQKVEAGANWGHL